MLKALLLDLDNTLVLFDEPAYYKRYFSRLAVHFTDIFPPLEFEQRLISTVRALSNNNGAMHNLSFFINEFSKDCTVTPDLLWGRFMAFYETEYAPFGVTVTTPPGLDAVFRLIDEAGIPQVLASNPYFPLIAQKKRLAWGGVASDRFSLFTHIENMSYIKPQRGYYQQICHMLRVEPEHCMMVGNDPVNDMAAAAIGMKTYLTTDIGNINYTSLSDTADAPQQQRPIYTPEHQGSFSQLGHVLKSLL